MAEIRDQLTLVDRFSSVLDRYTTKMSASAKMSRAAERQVTAANTNMTGNTSAAMTAAAESAANSTVEISGATQSLIDRLASAQDALAQSFTATQAKQNLASLERQMKQVGLVWTSTAAEEESAMLLTKDSLSDLARQGRVTASAVAEGSYKAAQARREDAAAAAAEKAAAKEAAAAARAENTVRKGLISRLVQHTQELIKNAGAAAKARQAHDVLGNKLLRMGAVLFTARRMMRFLADTIERAPNDIQKSWKGMANGLRDTVARGFVSMLKGMQPAMDRFNKFMASPAGQRMARGLETAMKALGQAVGVVLDKIIALGEWIGNNFSTVMEVAGVLALAYAANMTVAAIATMAVNWPLTLLIALTVAAVKGMQAAGYTAQDVFTRIGKGFGWLYAFIYNLFVDLYNQVAILAEFFANAFHDPLAAVAHLFFDTFSNILSLVETVAKAIDKLTGSSLAAAVSGFRTSLQKWTDETFGKNAITIDRKEKISYTDTMASWGDKLGSFADKFTNFSLDHTTATELKNIDKNTSTISKNLSDEDLKYLEDVAIRKYERNSNTTLAPQIKVVMQGNADKSVGYDIGNAIADILVRQAASHTSLTTQGV